MRLLIVEDEPKTAEYLSKGLRENGFIVDVADNGEDGLFLATTEPYDLAVIDVMLPKRDGFSILGALRLQHSSLRVLLLTARDAVQDRVKGLELGADDYLVKPFAFSELLARVRTILRRQVSIPLTTLSIADLTVDTVRHKVQRGSSEINLTAKEFQLLLLMLEHAGSLLSRTFIAEKVWDIHFHCDTNVIDVAVRRLRQKIDDPFPVKLIHTKRGRGYVLEERSAALAIDSD